MSDELTITCNCDERYLDHLIPLIKSINKNTNNTRLYIRLVNVKDDTPVREIINTKSEIIHDTKPLSTKRCLLTGDQMLNAPVFEKKKHHPLLLSEQACYCSNIKYNTINHLLERGDQYILQMDVDAIVRRDLNDLIELIKKHDIVIRKDKPNYDSLVKNYRSKSELGGVTYRQGVIGINNTLTVRKLFREVEDLVMKDMKNWDADQINFQRVFESMQQDIKFYNLPITYRDTCHDFAGGDQTGGELNTGSHIWSGSYKAKFTQDRYLREKKRYASL